MARHGDSAATAVDRPKYLFAWLLCLAAVPAMAGEPPPGRHLYDQSLIASDAELDASRGGFVLANGMIVTISIDKRIYQNGVETFASYFESPQELALLQGRSSGVGEQFTDSLLNSIVQNSIDNQLIETISNIDIELRNPTAMDPAATGAGIFSQFLEPGFQ